jgi:ABC-type lipoprotein release transport system permease subunit
MRWVLSYAVRWAGAGLLLGGAAVLATESWIRKLLYGVTPSDPWTIAAIIVLLALVAVTAAAVPAHRAARLDPSVTLRQE